MTELSQGVVLMLAGMGIVYFFLGVLVAVTKIAMGIAVKFDFLLPNAAPKKQAPKAAAGNDDENIALAIAVAMRSKGN